MKILRRRLADYVKKLHQKPCCTCSTIYGFVVAVDVAVAVAAVVSQTHYYLNKQKANSEPHLCEVFKIILSEYSLITGVSFHSVPASG